MGGLSVRDNPTHPVTQIMSKALPSHLTLKHRQAGQNTPDEIRKRDLKAELDRAERQHRLKSTGIMVEEKDALVNVLDQARILDADEDDEDEEDGFVVCWI